MRGLPTLLVPATSPLHIPQARREPVVFGIAPEPGHRPGYAAHQRAAAGLGDDVLQVGLCLEERTPYLDLGPYPVPVPVLLG